MIFMTDECYDKNDVRCVLNLISNTYVYQNDDMIYVTKHFHFDCNDYLEFIIINLY